MSRRNLVIARVGRKSLHPGWLQPDTPRDWDLCLCPFESLDGPPGADVASSPVIPGPKWSGLREWLGTWKGWRDYERIWLPDDDIVATQPTIDRFFDISEDMAFELSAPALHESSYYAHFVTMRNRNCFARRTGFVEIMAPCFSRAALEQLLPTLELSSTGWGWGLDSLWPHLLDHRNTGIVDATPVLHSRPVGAFRDAELSRRVLDESDTIMAAYRCRQVHTTFEALGPDRHALSSSPEALAALLIGGWSYLLDRNPDVLPWILEAQKPAGGWRDYPIAGAPSGGAALQSAKVS